MSAGSYGYLPCCDRLGSVSVFDVLKDHIAIHAAYNSMERESEHASVCQEGTREAVLGNISAWSRGDTFYPVCWLEGPAGSGKSTIAHTIAKQCDDDNRLAFSFFFSRGKHDRSDITKFVPTFAYQLSESLPVIQPSMIRALTDRRSTTRLCLRDQIENLIVGPILTTRGSIASMIVVIDGLDECSDETLLQELIQLLVITTTRLPFRFLFTSRPESHIQQTFGSLSTKPKTYFLSLRDFSADHDIRNYLQRHLSQIREQNRELMRNVPHPWPSLRELDVLVDHSEGLFIYVSTLVKFVADRKGLPQEKLQAAMTTHRGVDPLYDQVLSVAREFDYFRRVVGTIVYLREPLTVPELGQLLQLQSGCIRLALRGCQSVFAVPDAEDESIRPYHASLRDFLTDRNRAKDHFLDPQLYHVRTLVDCLQLIGISGNSAGNGIPLSYACQNWCYHLSSVLSHHGTIYLIDTCGVDFVMMMKNMEREWLRHWMYGLQDEQHVRKLSGDCESVLARKVIPILLEGFF